MTTGAEHKVYVSATAPATFDQAGYEGIAAADWEITPCMTSIPEIAKSFAQVDFTCLFSGTTDSARGVAAPIELELPFQDKPTQNGQILVKAAFDAQHGTPEELLSMRVDNAAGTQSVYLQVKVYKYGTGQRVVTDFFLRAVMFVGNAETLVEVNT